MGSDDVDRYLDTAVRLCRNINASEQAEAIRTLREELQRGGRAGCGPGLTVPRR
jgi:hypothetical protein